MIIKFSRKKKLIVISLLSILLILIICIVAFNNVNTNTSKKKILTKKVNLKDTKKKNTSKTGNKESIKDDDTNKNINQSNGQNKDTKNTPCKHEWKEYGHYIKEPYTDREFDSLADLKEGDVVECLVCGEKKFNANEVTLDVLKNHLLNCPVFLRCDGFTYYDGNGQVHLAITDEEVFWNYIINPNSKERDVFVTDEIKCKFCGIEKTYE